MFDGSEDATRLAQTIQALEERTQELAGAKAELARAQEQLAEAQQRHADEPPASPYVIEPFHFITALSTLPSEKAGFENKKEEAIALIGGLDSIAGLRLLTARLVDLENEEVAPVLAAISVTKEEVIAQLQ